MCKRQITHFISKGYSSYSQEALYHMHFDNSHSKTGQTTVNFLYSFHIKVSNKNKNKIGGHHGCDRMVVGFTTTYAISAYDH